MSGDREKSLAEARMLWSMFELNGSNGAAMRNQFGDVFGPQSEVDCPERVMLINWDRMQAEAEWKKAQAKGKFK